MKHSFVEEFESASKNSLHKINILQYFVTKGETALAELGKELDVSVPTVTKLVNELISDGFVIDFGKVETAGGRRPNIYGINPVSGYFLGVDIKRLRVNIALINFNGDIVESQLNIPFEYQNTPDSFDNLCGIINGFIDSLPIPKTKILNAGINISGRVNTVTGESFSLYYYHDRPLSQVFRERIGLNIAIDNDSRSMAYGEFVKGQVKTEKDVLYVNVSWGLGLGIIADGKLYYGKSGFSGEFGHLSVFDNDVICRCGKKGCLETEASGSYVYRRFMNKIAEGNSSILDKVLKDRGSITLDDIVEAATKEDMLAIELIEEVGSNLGKHIAGLINLFNPELVVIGGSLAKTEDFLLLPIKSAVRKFSLNLVSRDTKIKLSSLGDKAEIIGACMLARGKMLGLV